MDAPRFTRQDLLRRANAIRPGASDRLITDWIGLGLLDHPYKPGRGRAAGSYPGTWPETQMTLFVTLWQKRPDVSSIASLCNIPVYTWVYWGDDYIPLRQVRRVMGTWLDRAEKVSGPAADGAAAHILRIVENGRPSRAKRDLLAQALKGRKPDLDQIHAELTHIRTPRNTIALDSGRIVDVDGERVAGQLIGRIVAADQISTLEPYLFEWARFFLISAAAEYAIDQPELAKDSRHGWLFTERQHENLATDACANLLAALGVRFGVALRPDYQDTFFNPEQWRVHKARGIVRRTTTRHGGLSVEFEIVTA
jgi:hypothetical protein